MDISNYMNTSNKSLDSKEELYKYKIEKYKSKYFDLRNKLQKGGNVNATPP